MRKDVRLGLGVGGILFGVVLVYVLFFAGGKGEDQYAGGDFDPNSSEAMTTHGGASSAGAETLVEMGPGPANGGPKVPAPQGNNIDNANTGGRGADIPSASGQITGPIGSVAGGAGAVGGIAAPTAGAASWDWRKLMKDGDLSGQLISHTETPTPGGGRPFQNDPLIIGPLPPASGGGLNEGSSSTGPRTYTVRSGDSFWSIAAAEYGNANYYSHLVRANPKVDPTKLKAGMRITIPAHDEVIPKNAPPDALSPTPVTIDETRQYRVKKGDSLSRIATNLYGRQAMADKIYQLNRDVIGPNPSALKLNVILTLPEAPTRMAAGTGN
jgi:nucleoid-associated protein YgaU